MDHVAIMRKSWNLIPKILDKRKRIESRWSVNKVSPWGKVKKGDTIYFKNSGEPVILKAAVSKVKSFSNLTSLKVKDVVKKFGGVGGICFSNLEESYKWAKDKNYCTLIYLNKVAKVRPFKIDKRGFGIGAAWMTVEDINSIKT